MKTPPVFNGLTKGTAPDGTYYELSGHPEAPVVALIHGLGLCRDVWKNLVPSLSQGYRVLNYDLHGHGNSNPCRHKLDLRQFSDQLAELLNHLAISKAAVVGFSIGGMINRRFALDYPDLLSALIILNSPHDRGAEAQKLVEERAEKVREQGPMATIDEALLRWFTEKHLAASDDGPLVRQWREDVDQESYAQSAWVLASGVPELTNLKEQISSPTLVMTCENDSGSTPAMSREIASEIDGSQIIVVPELKHLGLMEKPSVFLDPISKFLGENLQ